MTAVVCWPERLMSLSSSILPLSLPATHKAQQLTVILSTSTKYKFFKSLCMFVTVYFPATRNSQTTLCLKPKSPYHDILTTSCTSPRKHNVLQHSNSKWDIQNWPQEKFQTYSVDIVCSIESAAKCYGQPLLLPNIQHTPTLVIMCWQSVLKDKNLL